MPLSRLIRLALAAIAIFSAPGLVGAQTTPPPAPPMQAPPTPAQRAEVRTAIVEGNKAWSAARVSVDHAVIQRMLGPDFYAQFPSGKVSRQDFITNITGSNPGSRLAKFTTTVLTIIPIPDGGDAIIQERIEIERTMPDGTTSRDYQLWVTRDRWRKVNGAWQIQFSEALGAETWRGIVPPFADWKD